jgi:hypothetical protein
MSRRQGLVIAFVLGIAFTLVVFIGRFECGEVQFPNGDGWVCGMNKDWAVWEW